MTVKWSQWSPHGMIRCSERELSEVMKWVHKLGSEAHKLVRTSDKPHAVYARKIHDESGKLVEVRLYCETYLDDGELAKFAMNHPNDILYVKHRF